LEDSSLSSSVETTQKVVVFAYLHNTPTNKEKEVSTDKVVVGEPGGYEGGPGQTLTTPILTRDCVSLACASCEMRGRGGKP
jgi:hypothetical protein